MILREELMERSSKQRMKKLALQISEDPILSHELIELILTEKPPISQYGAWLLQHCSDIHPGIILPHIEALLNLLEKDIHDGIRRAILRSLAAIEIPPKYIGKAAHLCFTYLEDPKVPVAVRVFSMSTLWNICKQEPDLMDELALLINTVTPTGSAALAARGRMVLKEMAKWKKKHKV